MDENKAPGAHGTTFIVLNRYAELLSQYLYIFFRSSLPLGSLPTVWLRGRVVPIHKTGDKLHPSNLFPIFLTSTCCKFLEHILASHIMQFLVLNKIMVPFQHLFRKKGSTGTQLISVKHYYSVALDNSQQLGENVWDSSKAFVSVLHLWLLKCLISVTIITIIVCWIEPYPEKCKQFVEIGGFLFVF